MSSNLFDRRGILRGLVTLPLIGGGVTLIGKPTAVAEPITEALKDAYIAFLAHEHRRALLDRFSWTDWTGERHSAAPMGWFPEHPAAELVNRAPAASRAAIVLSAVGCDWR